ncbi:unnamed protein product [Didymodactylos carnosus]|uniref:Transmembrane protein 143 n=1 Tax=Didymodactylos carnosus TaxID=1234261 RepID=A0A813NHV4_9BILA|nr:unnamed protein product [Didymodactylos carnosus]CAF0763537.1 unnamed protein product [Didymodactylos carnosus]CAF3517090.1 unnamed protein product [Didymodactylos carnosus]CAF3543502.1 unnamed protein product [Didymodactylos carnosus]
MLCSHVRFILCSSPRHRFFEDARLAQKYLLCISNNLSTAPIQKLSEKADHDQGNYPSFDDLVNTKRILSDFKKPKIVELKTSVKDQEITVQTNDLLKAKVEEKKLFPSTESVPLSSENSSSDLNLIKPSSSLHSTSNTKELFLEAPIHTPVLPGIPISSPQTTAVSSDQSLTQQTSSSTSRRIIKSITSRLPFLSSKYTHSTSFDIPSTRENFIPVTRPSLIRLIATDSNLLDDDERLLFHQLCSGFDSAVVQRYHPVLNELKHLFDPLNPDNETHSTGKVSYRDKLDSEYWLLEKIDDVLTRANFNVLPKTIIVDKLLNNEHSTLNVKVNGYDYDILKFWILGRESVPDEHSPWYKRLFTFGRKLSLPTQPTTTDYFKRVILAVRLKGQDRLYLKAFRDIPLKNLTQLLPIGRIQIGSSEQQLLWLTLFTGTATVLTKLITIIADIHVPGIMLAGGSLTLFIGSYAYKNYTSSKFNYFTNMNRLLFYKNIANNKSLLAMIVDRAEDELSKEILLVYIYLLSKQKLQQDLTVKTLEIGIENWLREKTNSIVNFSSEQSIEFLRTLGILQQKGNDTIEKLNVIPIRHAVGILPMINRTLSEKNEEMDLIEGYDKKYYEIDWKTMLYEDKQLKKGGWK